MTYRGPFVPHFPRRTSTLRRRLASLLAIHRYAGLAATASRPASLAYSLSGAAHPCFARLIGIVPRFTARRLRHRAYVARSLTTPGLRSGSPVRSPLLVPRHCAFPALGRYDPADRASASLRWPSVPDPPGGILPPGLVMRRHPCRRRSAIYPAWRLPAEDCDALRVRRTGRYAETVLAESSSARLAIASLN